MAWKEKCTTDASFCGLYNFYDDYYFLNAKYFLFHFLVSYSY